MGRGEASGVGLVVGEGTAVAIQKALGLFLARDSSSRYFAFNFDTETFYNVGNAVSPYVPCRFIRTGFLRKNEGRLSASLTHFSFVECFADSGKPLKGVATLARVRNGDFCSTTDRYDAAVGLRRKKEEQKSGTKTGHTENTRHKKALKNFM